MSASDEPRVLDSFTAPKDVLDEFVAMADEKDTVDPFRETGKKKVKLLRPSWRFPAYYIPGIIILGKALHWAE